MDKKYGRGETASLFDFIKKDSSKDKYVKKSNSELSMHLEKEIDPLSWILGHDFDKKNFKLFEDVGQIYELQLAKMEYESFKKNLDLFRKRTAYFKVVNGEKSYHYFISKIKGKGQIGHTNQYLTCLLYTSPSPRD